MILNLSDYIKNNFFWEIKQSWKFCIVSDSHIECGNNKLYKIDIIWSAGQIKALSKKYSYIFVVLDRLNFDNIYWLYKTICNNVCILNLNAWYTGLWKKIVYPDLNDVYINDNIQILEPMDLENFKTYINEFINNKLFTYIRIPSKDVEKKIWNDKVNIDYKNVVNFDKFWFSGLSGMLLIFGSMMQEWINVAWLLQEEWIFMDLFWVWNYKNIFSKELIRSIKKHEKIFIIWDFDDKIFEMMFYSVLYKLWLFNKKIYFICPKDFKLVFDEVLSEQVKMNPIEIYKRIYNFINNS